MRCRARFANPFELINSSNDFAKLANVIRAHTVFFASIFGHLSLKDTHLKKAFLLIIGNNLKSQDIGGTFQYSYHFYPLKADVWLYFLNMRACALLNLLTLEFTQKVRFMEHDV
jgi:hypothetical protein